MADQHVVAPNPIATAWLGLEADDERPQRWRLTVAPPICGRTGYLHGGCSLAAAAVAMEQATGRPLLWATAQYLSRAAVGQTVHYDVTIASAGNRVSQASVIATAGDTTIGQFLAALGRREDAPRWGWGRPPTVPPPADCPVYELSGEPEGSFHRTVDLRVADLDTDAGTAAFWVQLPHGAHRTSAGLAALGDYVPAGFRLTLGEKDVPASSLDNTVRILPAEPADWVLLDIRLGAIAGGAAHGDLRAWTPNGQLAALASQTFTFNPGAAKR